MDRDAIARERHRSKEDRYGILDDLPRRSLYGWAVRRNFRSRSLREVLRSPLNNNIVVAEDRKTGRWFLVHYGYREYTQFTREDWRYFPDSNRN